MRITGSRQHSISISNTVQYCRSVETRARTVKYRVRTILELYFKIDGTVPSAMEFLDMEKFTSILCLFVCLE